jgi:tight adherence protein C
MPIELILTFAALFGSVALLSGYAATLLVERNAAGRRRLRQLTEPSGDSASHGASLTQTIAPGLQRLASFVPKSPKDMGRIQKRLAIAGYHGLGPAVVFAVCEVVLAAGLGGASLVFARGGIRIVLALLGAMAGYILPGFVLERRIAKRQRLIQNGLPDALDLFIVCIEAGSSIDQAIVKTSQDLDQSHPILASELRMISTEMRAGKARLEAFRNFAARTEVDDVRSLVNILAQSDRFGTSIATALRTHAEVSRTKRRQRAEERANKIGVKLVFPLVFCLFPAFYVVTLGPGVIVFIRFFEQQLIK